MRNDNKDNFKLNYIKELFIQEDNVLRNANDKLAFDLARISLDSIEAKMLYMLIKMMNINKIVEVGTLAGHSALWMAKAMNGGLLYTIENNQQHQMIAQENFNKAEYGKKITLLKGTLSEHAVTLEQQGPFDMIFIDADKGGYIDYLDWAEQNICKNGLIVADNCFLFDTVYLEECPKNISKNSWNIMKLFNKRLADNSKYDSLLFPTQEGLVIALKKF